MDIVTLNRLNRALAQVQDELDEHGFFDSKLQQIDVYLTWFGYAFGWCWYGTSGDIGIPALSFGAIYNRVRGESRTSLRDVSPASR